MIKLLLPMLWLCSFPFLVYANDYPPYVSLDDLPNAVKYLPPPPASSSQKFFYDWSQYEWGKSMRETPRGEQAKSDATLDVARIAAVYSEAMGVEISAKKTPALYELIGRTIDTAINATRKAKRHYLRIRPYAQFHEPSLVPKDEAHHNPLYSYPSGHTAVGWAVALILVEIYPEAQDAILARGFEYGQSRVIAGYHYQSDVDAGRLVGSAAVARLHADPEFTAALTKAKQELRKK